MRITAPIRPETSATPMPMMATSTVPSGAKLVKVVMRPASDAVQPVDRQQAHRLDELARRGVRDREVELGREPRQQYDTEGEQREQRRRIGQRVADPLDHVEEAIEGAAGAHGLCRCVFRHRSSGARAAD